MKKLLCSPGLSASYENWVELARFYIGETMPKIRGKVAILQAIDPTPVKAKDIILANDT